MSGIGPPQHTGVDTNDHPLAPSPSSSGIIEPASHEFADGWDSEDTVESLVASRHIAPSLRRYHTVADPAATALLVLSSLAALANLAVLFLSRQTSGGRRPTLVLVRSLCLSDLMSGGVFGVAKWALLKRPPLWVNCFLPEALLATALVAQSLVLAARVSDCLAHTAAAARLRKRPVDKYTSIFWMILLWNASFVIGFLPHMGWSNPTQPTQCLYFDFYRPSYLVFVAVLCTSALTFCLCAAIATMVITRTLSRRVRRSAVVIVTLNGPVTITELARMRGAVVTGCLDAGLHAFLVHLPFSVYTLLHCDGCHLAHAPYADAYLLAILLCVPVKATLAAVLRAWRTPEIAGVLRHFVLSLRIWLGDPKTVTTAPVTPVRYSTDIYTITAPPDDHMQGAAGAAISTDPEIGETPVAPAVSLGSVSLGNLKSGLMQASSLATAAAAAVRLPDAPLVTCERCGHMNGCSSRGGSALSSLARRRRGSGPVYFHPLQLVYGGRQWQQMQRRRPALSPGLLGPSSALSGGNVSPRSQSDRLPIPALPDLPQRARAHSVTMAGKSVRRAPLLRKRSQSASFTSDSESSQNSAQQAAAASSETANGTAASLVRSGSNKDRQMQWSTSSMRKFSNEISRTLELGKLLFRSGDSETDTSSDASLLKPPLNGYKPGESLAMATRNRRTSNASPRSQLRRTQAQDSSLDAGEALALTKNSSEISLATMTSGESRTAISDSQIDLTGDWEMRKRSIQNGQRNLAFQSDESA